MKKVLAATIPSLALVAVLAFAGQAAAAGSPDIAALQVGLRAKGLYAGTVDGVLGPGTETAVRRFQRRHGLAPDGVPGPRTRKALGRYGRRAPLGRRPLAVGKRGWDVAALQFALAWHGFPSGTFDGYFGSHTDAALRSFQVWAGIEPDGNMGPATVAALRRPLPHSPLTFVRPLAGPIGDPFGPRGARFHAGIDIPAPAGTPVSAAGRGHVVFAGPSGDGWGNLVVVAHRLGVRTRYAHLSRIDVRLGERVSAGSTVGLVGATGEATGSHLHFEVVVRGANVDPLSALSRFGARGDRPAAPGGRSVSF
jgi:murein DD-endopeptidase MepM/ murein hydrolase activator NlpD